jgi:hypothetical protein
MFRRSVLMSAGLSSLAVLGVDSITAHAAQADYGERSGPDGDDEARLSNAEDSLARANRVGRLKNRIRELATANTDRQDNLGAVQRELEPLIRRLVESIPRQSEEGRLRRSEGAWRTLWSNLDYGGFVPDLRRLFQVVTLRGHYWNLSQSPFPVPGVGVAFNALRGAYASTPQAPTPGSLAIRFTRTGFGPGTLVGRTGPGLVELAAAIEIGAFGLTAPPGGSFTPPPTPGTLVTRYIDNDLRILGGSTAPVFDDQGVVSVPGQFSLLFVVVRQTGPVV